MNRQSLTISAALLAVVVVILAIFLYLGGDETAELPATITGEGQAGEARGIIAETEARRSESGGQAAVEREPVLLEQRDEQPAVRPREGAVDGGAVATTPEPAPAVPTGADAELDETFGQALEFRETGQLDDALMLFFYAARQGHPRSAFAYAEMNDPNHHSPETSPMPEPDANAALRFYRTALDAGYEDAAERIDALHQWATEAAAAGDTRAEMLLLQWEQ